MAGSTQSTGASHDTIKLMIHAPLALVALAIASTQEPGIPPGVNPIHYQQHDYSLSLSVLDPEGKPIAGAASQVTRAIFECEQKISSSTEHLSTQPTDERGKTKLEFKSLPHYIGGGVELADSRHRWILSHRSM